MKLQIIHYTRVSSFLTAHQQKYTSFSDINYQKRKVCLN